jgi:outer membrane murein-binding lipoprotein Lpp
MGDEHQQALKEAMDRLVKQVDTSAAKLDSLSTTVATLLADMKQLSTQLQYYVTSISTFEKFLAGYQQSARFEESANRTRDNRLDALERSVNTMREKEAALTVFARIPVYVWAGIPTVLLILDKLGFLPERVHK